jgi:hypothetical protein
MRPERTDMRRPAVEMAAAVMAAAEMTAASATVMAATMVTSATAAAVTAPMATASRDSKVGHGQRRRDDNDGNSQSEFRHGASDHCPTRG